VKLLDALGDGPAVFRFERNGLEDQEIESALDEIRRLAICLDCLQL